MASSSSNEYVTVEVGEEYPYPSHVCAASCTSVKLSGRDKYVMWKTQMVCLLESHGMSGFIDGTFLRPPQTSINSVSGKEKVGEGDHRHRLWRRSDAVVKSWILGSLSEQTLGYALNRLTKKLDQQISGDKDFSAKDVWDELQTIYSPAVLPQQVEDKHSEVVKESLHPRLYEAALNGNLDVVKEILSSEEVTLIDKITNNGNTALHVAVSTTQKRDFLWHLLELTPEKTLLDARNSDGSTPLHLAVIIGNTEAADILVDRNRYLLFAKDHEGHAPFVKALYNRDFKTFYHLLRHMGRVVDSDTIILDELPGQTDEEMSQQIDTSNKQQEMRAQLFAGTIGDELLVIAISSKQFALARFLLEISKRETLHSDAVLLAIAQNHPRELSMLEEYTETDIIRRRVEGGFRRATEYIGERCVPLCGSWVRTIIALFLSGIYMILWLLPQLVKMLVRPFVKETIRIHDDAMKLLGDVCGLIKNSKNSHHYYANPILEATTHNVYEVVERIVNIFPNSIWSINEDGHNIIQHAVVSRSEKVYNLVYQMSEHKNIYRTIKDPYGNNLLHLAARLAPTNKLSLISGAALQVQRELQWFEEVRRFVYSLNVIQKNSFGETPQMVFTREHKDLVIEGEKWMKATAESYTITAALITTIVFAAAITVPGGNKDTGIPIFTNDIAFTIFAISDAISLFTSVTSLLMFLSILTARFAERDFLYKLPTKLIIGLTTLFISTTAMIVAFGATLFLVFGQSNSRMIIPIAVLTCLPITSFVTLQLPLVIELMSATYGRSIFGKKRDTTFL